MKKETREIWRSMIGHPQDPDVSPRAQAAIDALATDAEVKRLRRIEKAARFIERNANLCLDTTFNPRCWGCVLKRALKPTRRTRRKWRLTRGPSIDHARLPPRTTTRQRNCAPLGASESNA